MRGGDSEGSLDVRNQVSMFSITRTSVLFTLVRGTQNRFIPTSLGKRSAVETGFNKIPRDSLASSQHRGMSYKRHGASVAAGRLVYLVYEKGESVLAWACALCLG